MLKNNCSDNSIIDSQGLVIAQQPQARSRLGRRGFLKRLGLGGTAILPATGWLADSATAQDGSDRGGGLSDGDAAILSFLAAVEYLETDFWQQYTELALGNAAYQQRCKSWTATCQLT